MTDDDLEYFLLVINHLDADAEIIIDMRVWRAGELADLAAEAMQLRALRAEGRVP